MAIDTPNSSVTYAGNNSTVTPYFINFPFLEDPSLIFVEIIPSGGIPAGYTNFTVHDIETDAPYIRTGTAIPGTTTVEIYRYMPIVQPIVVPNTGRLPSGTLDQGFDRATMQIQQVDRELASLALKFGLHKHDDRYPTIAEVTAMLLELASTGFPLTDPRLVVHDITTTGATVIPLPAFRFDGQVDLYRVHQSGGHAVTLAAGFNTSVNDPPLQWSITASLVDYLTVKYRATGNKWDVMAFRPGYPA